ncbi:unnamed protein product [Toxocara canis]|uniref:HintN domain-containing protein n=1 Tax=Toxocara canis TaxID=6265 RepID=A0A183U794_TOXCA|nr:unnamed protein product [Toxocara canis]
MAFTIQSCFTGEMLVRTPKGEKRLDQLNVGDLVMTSERNTTGYTRVLSFLHRLPQQKATFITIMTDDGHILKATPLHFIYRTNCAREEFSVIPVYAQELRRGDCLYVYDGRKKRKISTFTFFLLRILHCFSVQFSPAYDYISSNVRVSLQMNEQLIIVIRCDCSCYK